MARNPELRQFEGPAPAGHPRGRVLVTAAALAALVAGLFVLVGPGGERPAPPSFLAESLGSARDSASLARTPTTDVAVEIRSTGYSVAHTGGRVVLSPVLGSAGAWKRFDGGVARRTSFGTETITVDSERTEQYLTVERRQGVRTWRWQLDTTRLTPRLTTDGAIELRASDRSNNLRISPVQILNELGQSVTPHGLRWQLAERGGSTILKLRLDDRGLPLPYTIDPAVNYPSPLYFSDTAASLSGTTDRQLVTAVPSPDTGTTITQPARNATGYYQLIPGTTNSTAAAMALNVDGWLADFGASNGATGFPAGNWDFILEADIPNTTLTAGAANYAVGMWKGTVSGGAFTSTGTLLTPTDDPLAQDIRPDVNRNTFTITYALPAFSLAANETLWVQVWRNQTAGINTTTTTRRQLVHWNNNATDRIVHPAADDVAPAAPTQTITESSADSHQSGSIFYYRPAGAGGTFTVTSATSDTGGSGVQDVTFPGLAGGFTPATPLADTTSPYSQTYTWPATTGTETGSKTVTATDNALNTSTGTFTITSDSTGPTGSVTAPAASANVRGTTVSVDSDTADAASGVASAQFQRSPAGAGTWTSIGAADTSAPYSVTWDTTAVSDGLYDLRVVGTDNVANVTNSALVTDVRVDNTNPTGSVTAPAASANVAGAAVSVTSDSADAGSGVASAQFQRSPAGAGTWTNLGAADTTSPYAVSWDTTLL
ncbi:MAG: Ig-like domain-containing protein, partial [Actinobacteria bacterium]|nr:Ig-like domain-containing protein [Actinomycetota bacterium]